MKFRIITVPLSLVLVIAAGCARFPQNPGSVPQRTITFDLTVAGRIDPTRYYFIAIDNDQNPLTGPLPVVAPPWGNGWGTGSISHFVQYNVSQPGLFGVYKIVPGTDLQASQYIGVPFESMVPQNNTLRVTVDLDSIIARPTDPTQPQYLEINFITTDQVVRDPNFPGPKSVDGFGLSGNSYLKIPIMSSGSYRNDQLSAGSQEAPGDLQVPNPDVDIVDWKIEVRVK